MKNSQYYKQNNGIRDKKKYKRNVMSIIIFLFLFFVLQLFQFVPDSILSFWIFGLVMLFPFRLCLPLCLSSISIFFNLPFHFLIFIFAPFNFLFKPLNQNLNIPLSPTLFKSISQTKPNLQTFSASPLSLIQASVRPKTQKPIPPTPKQSLACLQTAFQPRPQT